jgi:Cys-tRNA(Pro) deacylase
VAFTEHPYDYVEHGGATHSAEVLGLDPFAVVKTLVMQDQDAKPLIVLMHGNRKVSTKNLARQIGAKSVEPCAPEVASRHSGYQVGGTSPFGTRRAMPVFIEEKHPGPAAHRCSTAGGAATWSASTRRSCVAAAGRASRSVRDRWSNIDAAGDDGKMRPSRLPMKRSQLQNFGVTRCEPLGRSPWPRWPLT